MFSSRDLQLNVFISYSRRDIAFVATVHDWLQTLAAYPTREQTLLNLWFDQTNIPLGENWLRVVRDGIRAADVVLLFISPDSIASEAVKTEIDLALARANPPVILPLLLAAVDKSALSGDPAALYASIKMCNWLDMTGSAPPYTDDRRFAKLAGALWLRWANKMQELPHTAHHPRAERVLRRMLYETKHDWAADYFDARARALLEQVPPDMLRAQYEVHALASMESAYARHLRDVLRDWWRAEFPPSDIHMLEYALRNPVPPTD